MSTHRFDQLDVFTATPLRGNALAVVHDAKDLDDAVMAGVARWTNLSETTFLLPPSDPNADYRLRIFTPGGELPFAGHPTLGSCFAWLAAGGVPKATGEVVQQCGIGLVRVRRSERLAFAAPPLVRSGTLPPDVLDRALAALRLSHADVVHHQWADNGPGWCALMLRSADAVLALAPDWQGFGGLKIGVVGAQAAGHDAQFEVRAFAPDLGVNEDPVTGSLNAALACWLIGAGLAPSRYVAAQGAALGRAGRVHVQQEGSTIWIGGDVVSCVRGTISL